jgi:hypothetical protein
MSDVQVGLVLLATTGIQYGSCRRSSTYSRHILASSLMMVLSSMTGCIMQMSYWHIGRGSRSSSVLQNMPKWPPGSIWRAMFSVELWPAIYAATTAVID